MKLGRQASCEEMVTVLYLPGSSKISQNHEDLGKIRVSLPLRKTLASTVTCQIQAKELFVPLCHVNFVVSYTPVHVVVETFPGTKSRHEIVQVTLMKTQVPLYRDPSFTSASAWMKCEYLDIQV